LRRKPRSPLLPYTTLFRSWDLIKNRIGEDNGIKLEEAEVLERAKQVIAAQFGGQAIIDQLGDRMDAIAVNYLTNNEGENYRRLRSEEHTSELQSRENLVCR